MTDDFQFEDFKLLNKMSFHPRYQFNPLFLDVFLEQITSEANQIFLSIVLLALHDFEFQIDFQELAQHLNLDPAYIERAVRLMVQHGYFLEVIERRLEDDTCTHG